VDDGQDTSILGAGMRLAQRQRQLPATGAEVRQRLHSGGTVLRTTSQLGRARSITSRARF
jgi:hypothetical protein